MNRPRGAGAGRLLAHLESPTKQLSGATDSQGEDGPQADLSMPGRAAPRPDMQRWTPEGEEESTTYITGEVDVPFEVLQAHLDGELVIFVGAGASVPEPSGLMLFQGLADSVANLRHVPEVDRHRFAGRPDQLLGHLESADGTRDVHRLVANLLTPAESLPNANHRALVRIASSSPAFRMVTTNFERHLSTAARDEGPPLPTEFIGPALPLGRSFEGLVHLHGCTDVPDAMVLTDADFGTAYLTDAWAARFLYPMFAQFVVVFIGYSHNDTDMQYLARGLPQAGRRYILTDTPESPEWSRLAITPIAYPSVDGDHSEMTAVLEEWARLGAEGGLERRERVRDIVATPPSAEQHRLDYLSWALRKDDGAIAFCEFATHRDWLDWVVDDSSFASNWAVSPSEHSDIAERLGWWFADAATKPESALLALRAVQRHGGITWQLWNSIARALTRESVRDTPPLFAQWVAVLLSQRIDFVLVDDFLTMLAETATWERNRREFLLLLAAGWRPRLELEPSFSVSSEVSEEHKPTGRIVWLFDDYWSDELWTSHVEPNLEDALDEFLVIGEQSIRTAVALSRAYSGARFDALSFRRSAIELHTQDHHRQTSDVLIDLLRDGLTALAIRSANGAALLVHRWLKDDYPIFKRLGLHGLGTLGVAPSATEQ